MAGIIWLASYPKSGNTWLRIFLANYLADRAEPLPIDAVSQFGTGDCYAPHYRALANKPDGAAIGEADLDRLRPAVHRRLAAQGSGDSFVKTHSALIVVRGVPTITPDATAGAIYVVRNPLDVAVSFAVHNDMPQDRAVEALCTDSYYVPAHEPWVDQYVTSWRRHVASWLDAPGLTRHLLRYEDMLADPESAFAGVLRFLGLPVEPDRLARAVRHASFDELSRQEARHGFAEGDPTGRTRFFRRGESGAWREALTADQIQRILEASGETMRRLDYAVEAPA